MEIGVQYLLRCKEPEVKYPDHFPVEGHALLAVIHQRYPCGCLPFFQSYHQSQVEYFAGPAY